MRIRGSFFGAGSCCFRSQVSVVEWEANTSLRPLTFKRSVKCADCGGITHYYSPSASLKVTCKLESAANALSRCLVERNKALLQYLHLGRINLIIGGLLRVLLKQEEHGNGDVVVAVARHGEDGTLL